MNTLCFDSPLTPTLSPLRGEGDGTRWMSLVAAVVWMGSGFGGGRLRTASPTTCEVSKRPVRFVRAVVRALVRARQSLALPGFGEQARRLRYGKPEACATSEGVSAD